MDFKELKQICTLVDYYFEKKLEKISKAHVQRILQLGYNAAAPLYDYLVELGFIHEFEKRAWLVVSEANYEQWRRDNLRCGKHKVYFYLAEGFEETELIYPLDLCRRAGLDAKTVSVSAQKLVKGSHGIAIEADMTVSDAEYSLENGIAFVLPGGMPGTTNLEASKEVRETIRYALENKKLLCAICAAPSVLGKAGALEGKTAVCYPGFEEYLLGAAPSEEKCVNDGGIITAVGAGAAHLFGLEIIAELCGKSRAEKIKNAILL